MLNAAREVKAGELSEQEKVRSPSSPAKGSSSKSVFSLLELTKAKLERGASVSSVLLAEALPIVEEAKKLIPDSKHGGPDFSKVCLLSSMHLLKNILPVFKTGFDRGLNPTKVVAVGKVYSDYPPAKLELKRAGVNVIDCPKWTTHDGFNTSFESACREACKDFQKTLTPDSIPIVIDDGGGLAEALSDPTYEKDKVLKRCVIIEQTTSGGKALKACTSHPRIKLCGAFIKNTAEPPLVAECTVANLKQLIEKFRSSKAEYAEFTSFTEAKRFGIVGAGNIGKAIIKELVKQGVPEIRVYDTDRKQLLEAVALGAPFERTMDDSVTERKKEKSPKKTQIDPMGSAFAVMQNSDIFIGATGKAFFTEGEVSNGNLVSKRVIAVSVSSRQTDLLPFIEYGQTLKADEYQKFFQQSYTPAIDINNPLKITNGYEGQLAILRHGTPITFNNGPHAMPPKHAQLTRLLIIGSELQALEIANEKLEVEFRGGTFSNLEFKLSPLWQLYTSISFFENLGKEKDAYFTEKELAEMMDIDVINKNSKGFHIYYPFELKLREWLKDWLKEHNLTEQVDKWLKESEPKRSVAVTPAEPLRLTA